MNALASLGIQATASGRNDLVVINGEDERKVSGSAYKETKDRGFHHGTLLLNADLSRLADYLNPDPKSYRLKELPRYALESLIWSNCYRVLITENTYRYRTGFLLITMSRYPQKSSLRSRYQTSWLYRAIRQTK